MPGKHYAPHEDAYLITWYPRRGAKHCSRKLGRPLLGVYDRVRRLGLDSGVPTGYVALADLARETFGNGLRRKAMNDAKRAGVLQRTTGTHVNYIVPETWADQYAERLAEETRIERETRGWYTSRDITRMTGVESKHLTGRTFGKKQLGNFLEPVTRVLCYKRRRHYRWHPRETEAAIAKWRASK